MAKITFKNCKFVWQLQEEIQLKLENLRFAKPIEFDVVTRILTLAQSYHEYEANNAPTLWPQWLKIIPVTYNKLRSNILFRTLNKDLQNDVISLQEYLAEPALHISVEFIKQNPQLFNSINFDGLALNNAQLQTEVFNAFRQVVSDSMQQHASRLSAMSTGFRQQFIKLQQEILLKKSVQQAALKAKTPPVAGSEASTESTFLYEMVGGVNKLQEIAALMQNSRDFADCFISTGAIEGQFIDEDQIQWSFEINAQDKTNITVLVRNNHVLTFNHDLHSLTLPANNLFFIKNLPRIFFLTNVGEKYVQPSSLKDFFSITLQGACNGAIYSGFSKLMDIENPHAQGTHDELVDFVNQSPVRREIVPFIEAQRRLTTQRQRGFFTYFLPSELHAPADAVVTGSPAEQPPSKEVSGTSIPRNRSF